MRLPLESPLFVPSVFYRSAKEQAGKGLKRGCKFGYDLCEDGGPLRRTEEREPGLETSVKRSTVLFLFVPFWVLSTEGRGPLEPLRLWASCPLDGAGVLPISLELEQTWKCVRFGVQSQRSLNTRPRDYFLLSP